MKESKWIVKIDDVQHHVWAVDEDDAIQKATDMLEIKACRVVEPRPPPDPDRGYLISCIDQKVIESLTDTELASTIDRINKELDYRQTDFLTIPDYNGLITNKKSTNSD